MKEFIFKGDWETLIKLDVFDTYYLKEYNGLEGKLTKKVKNEVSLCISDTYGDMSPEPKPEQIATINYLLKVENQYLVIKSIIKYLNEVIYPFYKNDIFLEEEYPESYPSVKTLEDFQKYFKLDSVVIYDLSKDSQSFYCLYFNVDLLDQEHGLSIELIKDKCIDHGTNDGTDGYVLAELIGLPSPDQFSKEMHSVLDNEEAIIYKPDSKYGKLKPWQIDVNQRFPSNAYKSGEDMALIEFIKNSNKPIINFKYLFKYAQRDNRKKLIDFFSNYKELE